MIGGKFAPFVLRREGGEDSGRYVLDLTADAPNRVPLALAFPYAAYLAPDAYEVYTDDGEAGVATNMPDGYAYPIRDRDALLVHLDGNRPALLLAWDAQRGAPEIVPGVTLPWSHAGVNAAGLVLLALNALDAANREGAFAKTDAE